jgi:hypothetical protein
MTTTHSGGFTSATTYGPSLSTHPQSMGWLAVIVALSVLAVLILGTMAQDRWCGAELCSVPIEQY